MKKLIALFLCLFVATPAFAKDYAKRFPTDTAMEVYTPNNPGGGFGLGLTTIAGWGAKYPAISFNSSFGADILGIVGEPANQALVFNLPTLGSSSLGYNFFFYDTGSTVATNQFIVAPGLITALADFRITSTSISNYFDTTVDTSGNATLALTGTNPVFNFSNTIKLRTSSTSAGTEPLQFTSGSLLTTPTVGTEEFLTDKFYGTITTGAARKEFTMNDAALVSGRVPTATTNGRLTSSAALTFSSGTLTVGTSGTAGAIKLNASALGGPTLTSGGSSSWNWVFPTGAGSTGQPLLSAAGGTLTWGTLSAANGGTGQTTYAVGDLLSADTTSTLSRVADVATGSVLISGGTSTVPSWSTSLPLTGKITKYNNITTAGNGLSSIVQYGRPSNGQTGAVASVAAYTLPASDGSFDVSANVNVTTATTNNFTVTCVYTDEQSVSRTLTFGFTQLSGATFLTAITNVTGTGPYESPVYHIRCRASSTITIATTGTFTAVQYNVEGIIRQTA